MTTDDWKKETSNIGKRRPSRVRKPAVIEESGAVPNVPEGPNYLKQMKAQIEEFKQKMAAERQELLDRPSLAGKKDTPWELDEERMMKEFEVTRQKLIDEQKVNLRPKGATNVNPNGEKYPLPSGLKKKERGTSKAYMESYDNEARDMGKFEDEFNATMKEIEKLKAEAEELRLDIKRKSLKVSVQLKEDAKESVRLKKKGKYPSEWDPASESTAAQ